MPFNQEQLQVLAFIKRAGNRQRGTIKTFKSDPFSGKYVEDLSVETYFTQVSLNSSDFANQSLANGLFKLLIPAISDDKSLLMDFNKLVSNKTAKFYFPDGRALSVINTKITTSDGVTPILARFYIGG